MGYNQDTQILSRAGTPLPPTALSSLKASIQGKAIIKGEADEATYHASIDRFNKSGVAEAGIVVFVKDEQDIAAALHFVQKWDLELAIACGRHSYYKASTTRGGLVIDLKEMKRVVIDEGNMIVTAQGGCQAIDLEAPLLERGLMVVMGAANDTGIGGLTLGGGSGLLTGQHGLVIDNLVAAKVVTANGTVLEASEEKNPDLFCGIRGGGSNFGIVTEFTFKVHNQGPVWSGPLIFTPDKNHAFLELAEPIRLSAEASGGKFVAFFAFAKGPGMPSVHPLAMVFYDGPEEEGKEYLQPLLDLGPVVNHVEMKRYIDVTTPTPMFLGPPTHQFYSTSNAPLTSPIDIPLMEGMIADLDKFFVKYGDAVGPSKLMFELRSYAKSSAVAASATALRARVPAIMMAMEAQTDGSIPEDEIRAEVKKVIGVAKTKGGFINANIGDGTERVAEMFEENFGRLRELKRKYDPTVVFDKWYPIPPAEV